MGISRYFPETHDIREWAGQLAGEARDHDWYEYCYVVPDTLMAHVQRLVGTKRQLTGLIGRQGVGKSSALKALQMGKPLSLGGSTIFFKWRREGELFKALFEGAHEATNDFIYPYYEALIGQIQSLHTIRFGVAGFADAKLFSEIIERTKQRYEQYQTDRRPSGSDISWLENKLGRAMSRKLRQEVWLQTVRSRDFILIDTPDYSKTDKRRMDRDLEDIYWFWNKLMATGSGCTVVVAIQKEMFRGHYFLDKMKKFELKPLPPEKMVEAYVLEFNTLNPFSKDALLAIARMSRGIFRRFLRYILYTLDFWERPEHTAFIDEETARNAIPLGQLAEDMELEFLGSFPKHSELRLLAVRLIFHLQENGPQKQSDLAREFEVEPSAMSRLLTKLESTGHVRRTRDGLDKIVSLQSAEAL